MKYVAKPRLANSIGMKTFDDAKSAVEYLNEQLSDKFVDPKYDYVFTTPRTSSPKALKRAVEDYVNIGKLIVQE